MRCPLATTLPAALALAGVVGACQQPAVAREPSTAPAATKHQPSSPAPAPAAPSEETKGPVAFTLYFASREYVETGNDRLHRWLTEPIALDPETAAEDNDHLAAMLLLALGRGPASAHALPVIPARIQVRSVHVREGVAELDLASEGLNGGSLEEQFLVDSIVRTLTQLPEVHAVRFLVEGKPTQTLMGHVSTAQPLSASE